MLSGNIVFNLKDYSLFKESKKKPKEIEIGDQVCYFDGNNNIWLWLKLETEKTLITAKGEGECPSSFPTTQVETWER